MNATESGKRSSIQKPFCSIRVDFIVVGCFEFLK